MSILIDDTYTARSLFPVVNGMVTLASLPFLSFPAASSVPAGTLIIASDQAYKTYCSDGSSWNTIGGVSPPIHFTDSLPSDYFIYSPGSTNAVDWREGVSSIPNGLGPRPDNVKVVGWNLSATSGVIDPTKGYLGLGFEDYWYNSNLNDYQSEFYIQVGPPAAVGSGYRPIAVNTSQTNTLTTKMLMTAHEIDLGAGAGPSGGQTQISITDSELVLYSPNQSRTLVLSNAAYTISGPSNNATGTQTLFLFDADPAQQPGAMARFLGGVLPATDRTYELGRYTDGASGRYRWSRVCASYGQFITQSLASPSYNNVGSIATLWDDAELTISQPWILLPDASSLAWYRLPSARDWALDAAAPVVAGATVTVTRPIMTLTGVGPVNAFSIPSTLSAGGKFTILPTGNLVFNAGATIQASFTATANVPVECTFDGTKVWLR